MNRTGGAVRRSLVLALGAVALASVTLEAPRAAPADYPTETLADYVFGCMATNGQSQEALRRCSCSIDAIAAKLPTRTMSRPRPSCACSRFRAASGRSCSEPRPWAQAMIDKLRQAQVEAELRCF